MKKLLFIIGLSLVAVSVSAQETPKTFTREAGDISVSVDASPLLQYVGNLFNTSANAAPTFSNGTLMGSYFLSPTESIDVSLKFGFDNTTTKTLVNDVNSTTTPPAQVVNSRSVAANAFALNLNYALHMGTGRLQASYGGGLSLAYGSGGTTYKYGNALSSTNTASRTKSAKNGSTFGIGLNCFFGIEYFIANNISLGGQLGVSLMYQTAAKGKTVTEAWDTANNAVSTTTVESYTAPSNFGFDTTGTGFFVSFYF